MTDDRFHDFPLRRRPLLPLPAGEGWNEGESRRSPGDPRHSFSSGNTFTSTRRFFRLCSGLLGSVAPATGLSQPLPITRNLFGSNLYLPTMDFRTASARS